MSEHAPLTEAEREAWARLDSMLVYLWSTTGSRRGTAGRQSQIDYGKREARIAVEAVLAARTSTATNGDSGNIETGKAGVSDAETLAAEPGQSVVEPADRVKHPGTHSSTATADTGLRERVEALCDEWDEERRPGMVGIAKRLRAILDATAAPTTDTGARDE